MPTKDFWLLLGGGALDGAPFEGRASQGSPEIARPNKPWYRASKGAWYATVDGKKVSLGVKGEDNKAEALKAWHRLMAGPGEEPAAPQPDPTVAELVRQLLALREAGGKPKTPEPTVNEVVQAFLAGCEGRMKPNTLRVYRHFLTPFKTRHGQGPASDLTPTLAETYAREQDWSDSTRNAFLGTLATAFRWGVKARLIPHTPLAGLERPPKASRGAESLVTAEEHARLVEAATPAFATFLQVLYATGARPGEVAAISAENFDPALGVVRLKEHKTAHRGKSRTLHLTPEVTALLSELARLRPSGPLLRNTRGKAWTGKTLVKAMIATRERAGIGRAICYGYRHSFATDALAAGVPDAQVAELLGHSGTAMLHRHYAHLGAKAQALRGALNRVRGNE
jgi:integrase